MIDAVSAVNAPPARLGGALIDLDPGVMRLRFNRTPFVFRHRLDEHPLLRLESLIELANRLPEDQVRQAKGCKPVSSNFDDNHRSDRLTVAGVLADLRNADRFVLLWHPETDPAYQELLDSVLADIRRYTDPIDPGMCDPQGFIFIASPRSVTPYHMDREVNFLCQVRGTKTVLLWDQEDRSVLSEEELEILVTDYSRPRPGYRPELADKAQAFALEPGFGVHHPMFAPHAVTCGDEVSIAIAVTFRTRSCMRRMTIHSVNHRLRRRGRQPRPYGASPLADGLKDGGLRAARAVRSILSHR